MNDPAFGMTIIFILFIILPCLIVSIYCFIDDRIRSNCTYCTNNTIFNQDPPICKNCKYYHGSAQYFKDKREQNEKKYGKSYYRSRKKRK